jgi:hypothetical protein
MSKKIKKHFWYLVLNTAHFGTHFIIDIQIFVFCKHRFAFVRSEKNAVYAPPNNALDLSLHYVENFVTGENFCYECALNVILLEG